jgi:hypothetical protein
MNKDVKVRAWDEGNKVMHYNFQYISTGNGESDWIIFISDKFPLENSDTNPFINPNAFFSPQLKIMQWTGLVDANDIDIYASSICHVFVASLHKHKVGVIKMNNLGCWSILIDNLKVPLFEFISNRLSLVHDMSNIEVIGNIYEDNYLLNKCKKYKN